MTEDAEVWDIVRQRMKDWESGGRPHLGGEWLYPKNCALYLRIGDRYVKDRRILCFTVSNITVYPRQQGLMTRLLRMLEEEFPGAVYVENVLSHEIIPMLRRRGYTEYADGGYPHSWYKLKE